MTKYLLLSAAILLAPPAALVGFRTAAAVRETQDRVQAAPKTGRFVKAGDVELFVQETGPADGPAVLLLHGAGGWSEAWRPTLDAAAARGLRAIAVDLPPLGYSERPASGAYSSADQARRLLALLDALGLPQAAVVGHSFGARAAVELALLAPQRLRALVVVDGALSLPGDVPPVSGTAKFLLASGPLLDFFVSATATNPLLTKKLLGSFMFNPDSAKPDYVALYQRPQSLKGATAALSAWLPELLLPWKAPDYAKLAVPTLLLWGEADATTPVSLAEGLKKAIPGASLVVLNKAGHMLPLEDPAAFNKALLDALAPAPVAAVPAAQ